MEKEFYTISVYVDKDENLIGIPCGESSKYGIADIDTVLLLKAPYSAKQAENFIKKVFDACYTKKHNDDSNISTIERYTKKKGFIDATADYTLLSMVKQNNIISIMPTFNDFEKGPLCIEDDERLVQCPFNEGDLYEHLHDLIMIYVKANVFYKEKQELEQKKNKTN